VTGIGAQAPPFRITFSQNLSIPSSNTPRRYFVPKTK
jgi:hypothetical protein